MTETAQGRPGDITGQLYLYEKPELLTLEAHGTLGFTPNERPFDFVRNINVIPLTMAEFGSAQRHCPIVFSSFEEPVPLAVVGVVEQKNLFVDADGNWDPMVYLPTYLRCHPFAFASGAPNGQVAVVVDRNAATVTENPKFPFFVDGKISEQTDSLMQMCAHHDSNAKRTKALGAKLKELELLTGLRATYTPEGASEPETLMDYISIDADKLTSLDADTVHELHTSGLLSAMYLQLYSLENWRHLMARREKQLREAA
ncbi:MAG: SapC family protein [Woeseiaceae bacterium]|nr:SapC family protein [Woeseiaceae bacterium]